MDFEADLVALAQFVEAEELLAQLATALFPDGAPDRDRLTWVDADLDAEQRLAAVQARFRSLVEQIPAVTFMAVLGEGKNDVYVSPHIEQMLGYTQREWLEDPFLWYWRLHPDDRALWNDEFSRGCRTGGPFRAECRFLARDGRVVWVHGEARLIRDELGRPLYLQGVAFDITDARRAQESAIQHARRREELAIASRMQAQVRPRELAVPGYELAAAMVPAVEIGGDYHDLVGNWLAIGEASGRGLDASAAVMMAHGALAALVHLQPEAAPSTLVAALARTGEPIGLALVRLDPDGTVSVAGVHPDILLWRARSRTMERIRTTDHDTTLHLENGDFMILYTSGLTGERFGLDQLSAVVELGVDRSPDDLRDHVLASAYAAMPEQRDDMTVVVVRR
jgi:PAS domain S-box-containing protein